MNFPVFDLHCDTASVLLGKNARSALPLLDNDGHVNLLKAEKLPGYCQCFACFSPVSLKSVTPSQYFERQLETVFREVSRNEDRIAVAYTGKEIEDNAQKGLHSAVLTIEGPVGFDYDTELLQDLYDVGFRITTLGWNESNPLTGSHMTGEGLTDRGREYVRRAEEAGFLVDVSHISDKGFWDVMDCRTRPVLATHSNSRSVCNHSRNLTDEMFKAIASAGGVVGINLYTKFLGEEADLHSAFRHIDHFAQLDGSVKHIALGGDLDGCPTLPKGFTGVDDYEKLADVLLAEGYSEQSVHNIFWDNALEVFKQCFT